MPPRSLEPRSQSALDRGVLGALTVEHTVWLLALAVALLACTYQLGVRPFHHDESIHAFFSWKIVQEGVGHYRYDPVYHGPVLYYATALILWLFGDGDYSARSSAVLFGLAVLALGWPLRRYLGRWGALSFVLLLALSPSWIYFSRFLRHDVFLAFSSLAAVYCAFRYGDSRNPVYMYLGGLALGIAAATKEDMYLLGPWFLVSLAAMSLWGIARGEQRWGDALREAGRFARTGALPFLTALIVFATAWTAFYTSFWSHSENWFPVSNAITYWKGQQEIERIGGPWWYYLPRLLIYEPLIFVPALIFCVAAIRRKQAPDRFTRFAVTWALGSLLIYAWAQEKVPWLLVPQLLPLALLAARWLGERIESGALMRGSRAVPVAAAAAFTVWTSINTNFRWDAPRPNGTAQAEHHSLLAYVQSTYDIKRVLQRVEQAGQQLGTGTGTRMIISGEATWPLSWYLRKYPVSWPQEVRTIDAPIVIVDRSEGVTNAIEEALGGTYEKQAFEIRAWWEPNWREASPGALLRYVFTHRIWGDAASSDGVLYVHKDLRPGLPLASIAVDSPPSPRGYPSGPAVVSAAAVWGSQGSSRGEFREPRDLDADASGNIYIVDSKNHRIQKLSPSGEVLLAWGSEGSGAGQFKDPCGIAVGPDGFVYVADTWNHRIQKFDSNGRFIAEWRASDPPLWGPRGVVVAGDGTVFVTDTGNKRVIAYSPDGELLRSWGGEGSGPGQLIEPVGIAVNGAGEIVVADTGNRRLQFFRPDGTFIREWSIFGWDEFYTEPYIAFQGDSVYVTDSFNHRFARYRAGKLDRAWDSTGAGQGGLNRPIGIAAGGPGVIYVSDAMNHRIHRFIVE